MWKGYLAPVLLGTKWQSTQALLPGKSRGWKSLIGYKATVHGVTKSQTQLSDFTFTFFHFHSLEWSVGRREIKGVDLLFPSQLLFLIGQNFPPTVLNPANLQTLSLTSSCWGNETYVCVWALPLSLETVLRIRASALGRSGSKAGDKGCADPGPPTPGS